MARRVVVGLPEGSWSHNVLKFALDVAFRFGQEVNDTTSTDAHESKLDLN